MIEVDESKEMCVGTVVTCFNVLLRNLPGEAEKNSEKCVRVASLWP
jgi:hypothetical protein